MISWPGGEPPLSPSLWSSTLGPPPQYAILGAPGSSGSLSLLQGGDRGPELAPDLPTWLGFTLSSSPFLAALSGSAAEENRVGKRAVVFIWLLFISLCRYGSKFRELFLNDPASKENPFSKSTQNTSPLTNPKWKPFIVQNSKVFLL